MAGIGPDAEAVYRVSGRLKRLTGKFAYVVSAFKVFFGSPPPPFNVILRITSYNVCYTKLLRVVDGVYQGAGCRKLFGRNEAFASAEGLYSDLFLRAGLLDLRCFGSGGNFFVLRTDWDDFAPAVIDEYRNNFV